MFFNFFDTVSDVVIIPLFLKVSSHSEFDVFERIYHYVAHGCDKSFEYVLCEFILLVLKLIYKLIDRVKKRVFDNCDFESPEDGPNAEM